MLKATLSKKEFEALPEAIQSHYEQNGDTYSLLAEGLVPKDKLDEFRTTNIEVIKERDKLGSAIEQFNKLGGIEEFKRLKDAESTDKKEKLKAEDKFEEWKATWEEERVSEREDFEAKIALKDEELRRFKLTDKVRAAAMAAGINKEDVEDVLRLTESNFDLDRHGNIKVLDNAGAPYGGDPEHFFSKYYRKSKPKYFEGSGTGGIGVDQEGVSGPSKGSDGSEPRQILSTDHDAISANLDDIADGKAIVVDAVGG